MPHISHNPSQAHTHDIAPLRVLFVVNLAETVTIEDDVARLRSIDRSINETLTIEEVVARIRTVSRSIGESLSVDDVVARVIDVLRTINETPQVIEVVAKSWHTVRSVSESFIVIAAAVPFSERVARQLDESFTIVANVVRVRSVFRNIAENPIISAVADRITDQTRSLVESLSVLDDVERTKIGLVLVEIAEALSINAAVAKSISIIKNISESFVVIADLALDMEGGFFQRIMHESVIINTNLAIRACWLSMNKGPVPIVIKKVGRFFTRLPQQSTKPYTYRNKFTRYRRGGDEIR